MARARPPRRKPKAIAFWRYDQIEPALAAGTREARGTILRSLARIPVVWPSGVLRRISLATRYRWLAAYLEGGLEALQPRTRRDKGCCRARLPDDVVQAAYAILAEDDEIGFTLLLALLKADPALDLAGRCIQVARSTLARRLRALPGYVRLQRIRREKRRRGRFVARRPHQIWHLDAKGPVTVRLRSGAELEFHVLSVIDDASRACLAALVVPSPDLRAAVSVFRLAARRWGLPDLVYADRASIFDSVAFRGGLAQLGSHRIRVRPRNPEVNGKIEAYHRVLGRWYTKRLGRQQVVDREHLQMLLDAVIETVYQDHHHRELRQSPRAALAGRCSARQVAPARLEDAFREERSLKAHPKTGEVTIGPGTFLVPEHLRGQRLTFLVDPDPAVVPLCVEPGTGRALALTRAAVRPEDGTEVSAPERWGRGPLQALYDAWQGKRRPIAEPGFGLPEMFALLATAVGRPVPRSDAEAALIQRLYRQMGPLPRRATEAALCAIGERLGKGRPIQLYLDALAERVSPAPALPAPRPTRRKP